MPNITNLTLAQLRAATKAQIITAISNYLTNNFTKRQIIVLLMDADSIADPPARTYRTDGQIESETLDMRDTETAAVVASRQVLWSYYPSGEVDTITVTEGETVRSIKHYLDGKQPSVTMQPSPTKVAALDTEPSEEPDWLELIIPVLIVLAFAFLAFYFTR